MERELPRLRRSQGLATAGHGEDEVVARCTVERLMKSDLGLSKGRCAAATLEDHGSRTSWRMRPVDLVCRRDFTAESAQSNCGLRTLTYISG